MKLFSKYNRVNIITTVMVLLVTGIVYYMTISWILTGQKDKDLKVEEQEVLDYAVLNHKLPQTFQSEDQQITFSEAAPGSVTRQFINTEYFKKFIHNEKHGHHHHHKDGEYESGRGLITAVSVDGKYYKVLIVESNVETEDLISIIFIITIAVILVLLLVLLITNRLLLKRLWQPFYGIMDQLRLFNITDAENIPQTETSIDEFRELSKVVSIMTKKAKTDYTSLKTFTENASHELMTPIAVINSKLDTLIQTDNFDTKQSKLLNDLYGAVSRLNRLNQSLLLLVKLENNLLQGQQQLNLRLLVEELLVQFEEIFIDKKLTVTCELDDKEITGSKYLLEILLSNLLTNAIRHNKPGGAIAVILTNDCLVIENTGDSIALPAASIFNRFHKSSGSEGSGLGLTISRQICENLNFRLDYSFQDGLHIFTVDFN